MRSERTIRVIAKLKSFTPKRFRKKNLALVYVEAYQREKPPE